MKAKIIGRSSEISELEAAYTSNEAEFIALYGRRRVGKTFLIETLFRPPSERRAPYFQITGIKDGKLKTQLGRFAKELGTTFFQDAPLATPESWMRAFEILTEAIARQATEQRIVLFFDELPWLDSHKSGILSAIEYFWNRHWHIDHRVKLIVCGSSASWMLKKLIKSRGGLHNRVTKRINLKPFSLHETLLYLEHQGHALTQEQVLKLYMVLGGIPFYLKQLKKSYSVDQNISKLLFIKGAPLFDEFDEIFASLFDHSEQFKEIVTLISQRRDGLSRKTIEAVNRLTGKGGRLTERLDDLEAVGFITKHVPFGKKERDKLYKMNDEYCYFYLSWIEPVKGQLPTDSGDAYWKSCTKSPKYYGWLGYAFENICFKHLSQIKAKLEIRGFAPATTWRYAAPPKSGESGAQIDLLFDRDDDAITLCEIKFSHNPYLVDRNYARSLLNKKQVFIKQTRTKKQVFIAMISPHGVTDNLYAEELSGVALQNDLFKEVL